MPIADGNVLHIVRSRSLRLRIGHNVLISGIALIADCCVAREVAVCILYERGLR
jgi:hypothetical protein